jgi:transcriptional regulator with GAF, ATPase, and Fis domain
MKRVLWVTRKHYGLSDGSEVEHPFRLSIDWTVEQMQTVYNAIGYEPHGPRVECKSPKRKPYAEAFRETLDALNVTGWNQTKAARLLGISQAGLCYRVRIFNLKKEIAY